MIPFLSITNSARSEYPSPSRYAPYFFATAPFGSKSARRGKWRWRSLANAAWHHAPSTEMPRILAPCLWNSGRTSLYSAIWSPHTGLQSAG